MSLLSILRHLLSYAPGGFRTSCGHRRPLTLTGCCDQLSMREAKTCLNGGSFCVYCPRLKRGIMYSTYREHGYNVLALAQHLDDLAESFLMSAFHQDQLSTMKAH